MSEKPMDYWAMFAHEAAKTGSQLYANLSESIGSDEALKAMAARAKPGQPPPNMIFGAVHYLLLRGAQHDLRRFYPDLSGGAAVEGEDPFRAFRDFCLAHRAQIEALIASRVTNTNEVGRSSALHAGFRAVAAEAGEPLNLIEIGPSAGLNMIWDRYGMRYTRAGQTAFEVAPESSLVIDCELRGNGMVPETPTPRVDRRIGLELNPVDLTKQEDRDWLRALVWPDQAGRAQRLDKALALFDAVRPEIRAGDALALLADALREMPESEPLCVYHTIVTYQFSRDMRQALDDILTMAGLRRPVWRLAMEAEPDAADWTAWLTLMRYHDGVRDTRKLAKVHSHGTWLEWLE